MQCNFSPPKSVLYHFNNIVTQLEKYNSLLQSQEYPLF